MQRGIEPEEDFVTARDSSDSLLRAGSSPPLAQYPLASVTWLTDCLVCECGNNRDSLRYGNMQTQGCVCTLLKRRGITLYVTTSLEMRHIV